MVPTFSQHMLMQNFWYLLQVLYPNGSLQSNNILMCAEAGERSVLVLLDLSVTVTVDYSIPIERRVTITGAAFQWFYSCLSDSSFSVSGGNCSLICSSRLCLGSIVFFLQSKAFWEVDCFHDFLQLNWGNTSSVYCLSLDSKVQHWVWSVSSISKSSLTNLGVFFGPHVRILTRSCFFLLRKLPNSINYAFIQS